MVDLFCVVAFACLVLLVLFCLIVLSDFVCPLCRSRRLCVVVCWCVFGLQRLFVLFGLFDLRVYVVV